MSLVSTYVRATDGLLYKEPVLSGKGWIICFDDDDPPELVITEKSKLNPISLLKSIDLKYSKLRKTGNSRTMRCFGNLNNFEYAKSYYFDLNSRIDPKYITESDGKIKSRDEVHQGVIYDPT